MVVHFYLPQLKKKEPTITTDSFNLEIPIMPIGEGMV
jgi:hypothetical protein